MHRNRKKLLETASSIPEAFPLNRKKEKNRRALILCPNFLICSWSLLHLVKSGLEEATGRRFTFIYTPCN